MTIPKEIENWMKYEKVRRTGMFNMILGYKMASKTAGLSIKEPTLNPTSSIFLLSNKDTSPWSLVVNDNTTLIKVVLPAPFLPIKPYQVQETLILDKDEVLANQPQEVKVLVQLRANQAKNLKRELINFLLNGKKRD